MSVMEVVGAAATSKRAESAGRQPSVLRRIYEASACWWVLLRARILRTGQSDPEVEHCLKLQKGTRFQIRGGEVHVVDSVIPLVGKVMVSGGSRNDE